MADEDDFDPSQEEEEVDEGFPQEGIDYVKFELTGDDRYPDTEVYLWLSDHEMNMGDVGEVTWIKPDNPEADLVEMVTSYFHKETDAIGMSQYVAHPGGKFMPISHRIGRDTVKTDEKVTGSAPWTFENAVRQMIARDEGLSPDQKKTYLLDPFNKIPQDVVNSMWKKYVEQIRSGKLYLSMEVKRQLINLLSIYEGNGFFDNQIQTFMTCIDRYGNNLMVANVENSGLTFITRPRLCLQSSNLRSQRRMAVLDVDNPNTIAFAIRALLDTNLTYGVGASGSKEPLATALKQCPLINPVNPFFTPLMNALVSLTGLPDKSIESERTYGGYQQEAQTYATGGDDLSRSGYQLQLEFRELQGGIISSIFYFWEEYIRCVTRGLMLAYPDDIDEQCLNYTVSIYRFNLDPTGHYITDWCKCTGCYPISLPLGAKLQVNEGEPIVRAANRVSVTFECNKVEYRDYAIFMDFNTLMRRYCPDINLLASDKELQAGSELAEVRRKGDIKLKAHPTLPRVPWANFMGLPWITSDARGPILEFRHSGEMDPVFGKTQTIADLTDALLRAEIARKLSLGVTTKESFEHDAAHRYPEYFDISKDSKITDLTQFAQSYLIAQMEDDAERIKEDRSNTKQ